MNLFQDMLAKAFQNDENLSKSDKRSGSIDSAEIIPEVATPGRVLTETQQKWRQQMLSSKAIQAVDLEQLSISIDLFLTGVPNKDPSNDLYGSRVNISARDRRVGLNVPEEPTLSNVQIKFLPGGKCECTEFQRSGFLRVDGQLGDWIVSPDGTQVRFRFPVMGYTRRVDTKGTIQKVYWTDEAERSSETSTIYTIPEGWLYGETGVSRGNKGSVQLEDGVLKIEQSTGFMGVSTKMIPCGKFVARATE